MKFFRQIGKIFTTFVGIVIVICILAVACSGGNTTSNVATNKNSATEKAKASYEFVEGPTLTDGDFGSKYIKGILKNDTDDDKGYIQISFTLYDSDGNNIGTAVTNTNNLKAGGTWKFEAMCLEDNVSSYELDNVTGF